MKTVWITADQLALDHPGLVAADQAQTRILMIESIERGRQIRYHKRKLALVYSAMRHFAADLRQAGWTVEYFAEMPSFVTALQTYLRDAKPALVQFAAQSEYGADARMRGWIEAEGAACEILPRIGFIATAADFNRSFGNRERLTMEVFYRSMRKRTGLLMDGPEPVLGRWNYDAENRKAPPKGLQAPPPLQFVPDATTRDVLAMVERHFGDHPGDLTDFDLAVSRADALAALRDFLEHRLDLFGPYEDAIVLGEPVLYHSMLSAQINLGLLHPLECAQAAEVAYRTGSVRIESAEGFIRQLIGWREFIRGIYDRFMPEYRTRNALDATEPLPALYWGGETRMACMRDAVAGTLRYGYAHHIVRLMVLGNFGLLLGITPQVLNDWFWAMFIDGYDWVMVPNVIGMTLHADKGIVGTKPYAASARYIDGMSNACKGCRYSPRSATEENSCPFNALYWDFLARHRERFASNPRMTLVLKSLAGRPAPWLADVRARAVQLRQRLARGDVV